MNIGLAKQYLSRAIAPLFFTFMTSICTDSQRNMAESRNQSPNLDVASGRTPIPRPRSAQSRTTSPQTSPRAHVDHGDPLLSQTPDASTTLFSASPTPESREMLSYIERQTGRRRNRGNRTLPKPGLTFRVPSTSTMNATHNVSATQLKDVRAQVFGLKGLVVLVHDALVVEACSARAYTAVSIVA